MFIKLEYPHVCKVPQQRLKKCLESKWDVIVNKLTVKSGVLFPPILQHCRQYCNQGRNLGSTFGGVCSYNARQIGRGLRIARRKVQYYTWLLGG